MANLNWKMTPKTKDLPATQGIVHLVRSELKSDISSLRSEMNARFSGVEAQFETVHSALARMSSEISRIAIMTEEQNSKNNIVLEGLSGLFNRQEKIEKRTDEVERNIGLLGLSRRKV